MTENGAELRKIAWSQVFPFLRLFRTSGLALLNLQRMTLALLAVLIVYFVAAGILDRIWPDAERVQIQAMGARFAADWSAYSTQSDYAGPAVVLGARISTEIDAYATMSQREFLSWKARAAEERRILREQVLEARRALDADAPAPQATTTRPEADVAASADTGKSLYAIVLDKPYRERLTKLRSLVRERLDAGRQHLADAKDLDDDLRESQEADLVLAANTLQRLLAGRLEGPPVRLGPAMAAMRVVLDADPAAVAERVADRDALMAVLKLQCQLHQYEQVEPRGPFRSLLAFESRCFAAAVQGVCAGRWGVAAGALDAEPAMAGSMLSAFRGLGWLLICHPYYAVLLGLLLLLVFGFFGGAICRSAAVQLARDEAPSFGDLFRFACDKYTGFLMAPLMPLGMCIVAAILMLLGGIISAIPGLGEIVTGPLFILYLLGGFFIAALLLCVLLSFNLMWPTIAVEGSEGFDALSRAFSYLLGRVWHVAFYSVTLLLYGAVSFVFVRLIAMLGLKLTHTIAKQTINWDDCARLDGVGKLDAIWSMPAWADLSLLPSVGDVNYWGSFHNAPLNWSESFALFFFYCWVFLIVGLVGAFVVSFFYTGSTQLYLLVRREYDATDFDEIYYEEDEEDLLPPEEPTPIGAGDTATPSADSTGGDTPPAEEPKA